MAAIKNITPTKIVLLFLASVILISGVGNLMNAVDSSYKQAIATLLDEKKPIDKGALAYLARDSAYDKNLNVMALIAVSQQLPLAERLQLLTEARVLQEEALSESPADPYGWLRLSYLRRFTQGSKPLAFDALKMSINAAPYEPRIMDDRATAWADLESVQSPAEQAQLIELRRLAQRAKRAIY